MTQRRQQKEAHFFSATDVAEYEYCALAWWHDHFDAMGLATNTELIEHLDVLEEEYGSEATLLPEYQVAEQLLKRRGAFEVGHKQHEAHAAAVAEIGNEPVQFSPTATRHMRRLLVIALLILLLAVLLVIASVIFR